MGQARLRGSEAERRARAVAAATARREADRVEREAKATRARALLARARDLHAWLLAKSRDPDATPEQVRRARRRLVEVENVALILHRQDMLKRLSEVVARSLGTSGRIDASGAFEALSNVLDEANAAPWATLPPPDPALDGLASLALSATVEIDGIAVAPGTPRRAMTSLGTALQAIAERECIVVEPSLTEALSRAYASATGIVPRTTHELDASLRDLSTAFLDPEAPPERMVAAKAFCLALHAGR